MALEDVYGEIGVRSSEFFDEAGGDVRVDVVPESARSALDDRGDVRRSEVPCWCGRKSGSDGRREGVAECTERIQWPRSARGQSQQRAKRKSEAVPAAESNFLCTGELDRQPRRRKEAL